MVQKAEFTLPSSDGTHQLHAVCWQPDQGAPRAVVQLVHGISEHIGRYDAFAVYLADHGFAVVGHDHLGHGRTACDRKEYGFFAEREGWDLLLRDVRALRERTGAQFPGLPHFLVGHSMGSFVARTYLIAYPGTVDGCLLLGTGQPASALLVFGQAVSGVLCRLKGPRHVSRLVTALSLGAYNRQFRPNRTSADWISSDPAAVDAYVSDPLCRFVPTVGMFHDMLGGLRRIGDPSQLAHMDPATPVAFFAGADDPVGDQGRGVEKTARLFQEAGCRSVSVKLYPGARHELLNERIREQVYDDLLSWLEAHLAGTPG